MQHNCSLVSLEVEMRKALIPWVLFFAGCFQLWAGNEPSRLHCVANVIHRLLREINLPSEESTGFNCLDTVDQFNAIRLELISTLHQMNGDSDICKTYRTVKKCFLYSVYMIRLSHLRPFTMSFANSQALKITQTILYKVCFYLKAITYIIHRHQMDEIFY